MRRTIGPAPVRADIRVNTAPARAFEVFTAGMGKWWNRSFSIGTSPLKDVVIEPRPGGRWFERGDDGSECEWGKVLVWEPPTRLVLGWQITADWRYESGFLTELEIRFVPQGENSTLVELEHRNLERFGDKADQVRASFASPDGWPGLLKRYSDGVAAG